MSSNNPFGCNEVDKTIEHTINRDYKTGGGYIGFSANFTATQRWVLNESRRGLFQNCLENIYLSVSPDKAYVHQELAPARIKTDLEAVGKVVDLLKSVFRYPWAKESDWQLYPQVWQRLLGAQGFASSQGLRPKGMNDLPRVKYYEPIDYTSKSH